MVNATALWLAALSDKDEVAPGVVAGVVFGVGARYGRALLDDTWCLSDDASESEAVPASPLAVG